MLGSKLTMSVLRWRKKLRSGELKKIIKGNMLKWSSLKDAGNLKNKQESNKKRP